MQSYMSQIPMLPVSIEQALANIIDSIAMEDAALSGILNSESELIKKTANISKDIGELVSVNESVKSVIRNVSGLQIIIQHMLENAERLLREIEETGYFDELEE